MGSPAHRIFMRDTKLNFNPTVIRSQRHYLTWRNMQKGNPPDIKASCATQNESCHSMGIQLGNDHVTLWNIPKMDPPPHQMIMGDTK